MFTLKFILFFNVLYIGDTVNILKTLKFSFYFN